MARPPWDEYFMGFARAASVRATCDRQHVGAVIVVDKQVVATGYNGSVRGLPGQKFKGENRGPGVVNIREVSV